MCGNSFLDCVQQTVQIMSKPINVAERPVWQTQFSIFWVIKKIDTQSVIFDAGWSSPVARQAHNLKVVGSNPTPATNILYGMNLGPLLYRV